MSRRVEKSVGGLVQSLFGGLGSNSTLFGTSASTISLPSQPSLSFLSFLEQTRDAWKHSKGAERQFLHMSAQTWIKNLSSPSVSNGNICDILTRAMVAACRGYVFPELHIHAVKLSQVSNMKHKKMGYLYLSVCVNKSDLSLLVTNTLHLDLQYCDALRVLTALTAIPSILAPDLPPQLAQSLINCIHHPMSLVRRRACQVIYAGSQIFNPPDGLSESPLLCNGAVSALVHLLWDNNADVAIAATNALGALYKTDPDSLSYIRHALSCAASYLLLQAFNGSLPKHYNRPPQRSYHVQLSMIRTLRIVCEYRTNELTPPSPDVLNAVTLIITQAVGNAPLSMCMTMIEAILLTMELENASTSLKNTAMGLMLGFLKSDNLQLRYCILHTLSKNWSVFSDAITMAHLQAVVETLHDPKCFGLKQMTLNLLCTMANDSNYQSVITTILQNCKDNNFLDSQICNIISQTDVDVLWCYAALQQHLKQHHPVMLTDVLSNVVINGVSKNNSRELTAVALELSTYLLENHDKNVSNLQLSSKLLNTLNTLYENSTLCGTETKLNNISLLSLNETFVNTVKIVPLENLNHRCIFVCLLKIGLTDRTNVIKECIVQFLYELKDSSDLSCLKKSQEILYYLENELVYKKILQEKNETDIENIDWSLPFLDKYITLSLDIFDMKPYLPFSMSVVIDECKEDSEDGLKHLNNSEDITNNDAVSIDSQSMSCYSTPRVMMTTPSSIIRREDESKSIGLLESMGKSSGVTESFMDDSFCSTSATSSHNEHGESEANSMGLMERYCRNPKLLWSSEGRVNDDQSSANSPRSAANNSSRIGGIVSRTSPAEGIEVGAEASEDFSLNLNHQQLTGSSQSSASILANALYAGLARK